MNITPQQKDYAAAAAAVVVGIIGFDFTALVALSGYMLLMRPR